MNLHPDDNPLAVAFREELQAKRPGAYFEMGRLESSSAASPDPLLGENGFKAPSDWSALSPAEASACVVELLARPSLDAPALSLPETEALAARFRALASGDALFYSFDSGVLFVDASRMGRVWLEADE